MNVYKIILKAYDCNGGFSLINAETAGKAKYQHYMQLDGLFDCFKEYLHWVESCKKLRKAKQEDYFRPTESFERTCRYRGVPLVKCGTEVALNGRHGFIIGDNDSCNFDICFENGIWNCHPNYELVYYSEDGSILYDFRKNVKPEAGGSL